MMPSARADRSLRTRPACSGQEDQLDGRTPDGVDTKRHHPVHRALRALRGLYRRILEFPELFALNNEHSKLTCLDMAGRHLMIETDGTAVAGCKPIERSPVILSFNVGDFDVAAELLEARGICVSIRREIWGTVGDFIEPDENKRLPYAELIAA